MFYAFLGAFRDNELLAPVPRHTGTHEIIRFCSAGFACAVMADKRTTLIVGAHALIRFCLCRTAVVFGCSDPSLRARAGPRPGPGAGVTVSVAPSLIKVAEVVAERKTIFR